jgi:hypothetical protein
MPTHLYCLLAAESDSAPPADLPQVRALVVGGIVAWVSATPDEKLSRQARRAAELVVEHDRVVARALARGVTPVPATLADPYPSDAALIDDVSRRSTEILESLRRADGAVEMAIILSSRPEEESTEAPATQGPGRAYLERIREQPARLIAAADDLDRRLAPVVLGSSRRPEPGRLGLSHLVPRRDVEAYRGLALQAAAVSYQMVVDGPRAPYSFVAFSPRLGDHPAEASHRHETGRLGREKK